jgi:hypothetical protein
MGAGELIAHPYTTRRIAMKSRLFQFALLVALSVLITACGSIAGAAPGPDSELAGLGARAAQRARSVVPDATLRQLDIDWGSGRHIFRFTDAPATQEITVVMPTAEMPSDQWQVMSTTVSPLAIGHARAAVNLDSLRVEPAAAAQAMQRYRPGAQVRTLTLVDEGGQLVWYVFGAVAEGDISGKVSNAARTFQPLGPSPVQRPPTATPGTR